MKNYITYLAILLVSLISANTAFADVKIKIRQTMSGQTYENTTYIKGKRQRAEQNMGVMQTVNITQCDLKRGIQIMPQSQTYLINLWQTAPSVAPSTTTSKTVSATEKGGVVTMTYTTKDTGERKQMFGYTARHLIITMESESSPDSCSPVKSKMQTDGWYIDATFALQCENEQYNNYRPPSQNSGGCQDRYEMKQLGTGKRGYPLYEKTTMFDESGKETMSMGNEVIELSNTTLDAALFDIPAGYREVKNTSELYASMSSQSSKSGAGDIDDDDTPSNNSGISSTVKNMASKSQSDSAANNAVGAKKEGVVRVGLAGVKAGAVGEGMNAAELSAAIQNTLVEHLKNPQIEVVIIEAKLPSAIDAEAKSKECDFVVYAQVSHKKGGGFGGMFGKALGAAVTQTGGGAWGNTTANVAGAVAANTIVAANASQNVKSKDELTLDVKVTSAGGSVALAKQYKAKAKSDGEDIITPLIEQASQAIIDASSRK